MRGARGLSFLLASVLLASACGASPNPTSTPTAAFDTDRVTDILAAAGIGVYAAPLDDESIKPVTGSESPIQILSGQLPLLAMEASAGEGVLGWEIDELARDAGLPADTLPYSYFIAGWIQSADTPGAQQAQTILSDVDLTRAQEVVFPSLVLLLFTSDLAVQAREDAAAAQAGGLMAAVGPIAPIRPRVPAAGTGNFCVDIKTWVDSIIDSIFNTLKFAEGNGFFGFLAGIWNAGIDLARTILSGIATAALGPVVAIVRAVVTAIGTVSYVASFFKSWTVGLSADQPGASHFAHPGEPDHSFSVTAKVSTGGESDWTQQVGACASALASIPIPSPGAPGKTIRWTTEYFGDKIVAHKTSSDTGILDAQGHASAEFVAGREDPLDVNGTLKNGSLKIKATVDRIDQEQLSQMIGAMFGTGPAGVVIEAIFGSKVAGVKAKLKNFATASGVMSYPIGYHDSEGANCLDGIWEADLGSVEDLAEKLIGAVGTPIVGGSITRVYFASGKFLEKHDFILWLHSETGGGHFIDTRLGFQGYALGIYGFIDAPDANISYSTFANEYSGYVASTVDGAVTTAGGDQIDLGLGAEKREYTCADDTMTETWSDGEAKMTWHRIGQAPAEPGTGLAGIPTPRALGGGGVTVKVTVHSNPDQTYEIHGAGVCIHRTVGYEQLLTVRVVSATPSAGGGVPDSFDWSMTVREDGQYVVGDGPPTGTVGGASFQMQGDSTASFSNNLTKGTFSGRNLDVFGGQDIDGSYDCSSGAPILPGLPTPTPGPTPIPCANGAAFCGTATALIEVNHVAYPTLSDGSCAVAQYPLSQGGGWAFTLNIGTPNSTPGGPDYFGVVVDIPDPSALDNDVTFTDFPTIVGVVGGHIFAVNDVSITIRDGGTSGDFTGRDINTGELIRGAFHC